MENAPRLNAAQSLLVRLGLFIVRIFVGIVFLLCLIFAVVSVLLAFCTVGPVAGDLVPTTPNWKWLIPAIVCGLLATGAVFLWRILPPTGRGWLTPLLERGINSPVATVLSAAFVPFYTLILFANAYLHPHPWQWIIFAVFLNSSYVSVKEAWKLWRERCRKW